MGSDSEIGPQDHPVILFDGVCNLCNASVLFVIKRDPNGIFRFASLQSEFSRQVIGESDLSMDTILLIEGEKVYKESTAALRIAKELNGGWKLLYGLIIIPETIRDFFYRLISRNRYRLFGKRASCMVPTPELRIRFLDSF